MLNVLAEEEEDDDDDDDCREESRMFGGFALECAKTSLGLLILVTE